MSQVLEGVRALDLSRHMAGPYCSSLLADMGAEVIRIEQPGGDEDRKFGHLTPSGDSYAFTVRGRNKRGITLNLRSEEGKKLFQELVKVCDIVVESYAVRDKQALGVDYSTLSAINSRIVLVSITAFGLDGPHAQKLGFDPIAQAISGSMACTGFPGNPPTRSAVAWVDYGAALHAALGAMFALWQREKSGRGQQVDVSLLDVAAALMAQHGIYAEYKKLGVERPQLGNASPYAFADSFRAKDGWVFISCTRTSVWRRFLRVIEREDLMEDPRFKTDWDRAENRELIAQEVTPWVAHRTVQEIADLLERAQVPCGRINTIGEAVEDPQLRHRNMMLEYPETGELLVSGTVIKLSQTPGEIKRRAPLVGEHNEEIYCHLLGHSQEELMRWQQEGIV